MGSLFKKKPRSKSVEKKIVSPIESSPLPTPPAEPSLLQLAPPPKLMPDYKPQYHQYEVGEQPSLASQDITPPSDTDKSRWSRKSSISNSIYSTFGSESLYENNNASCENSTAATSVTDIHDEKSLPEKKPTSIDLAQIVANNVQTRSAARVVSSFEDQSTDGEGERDEEETEDFQGDEFVDATGISQEDIERERIEARLSKRLSGGHFGSAGGLMMSIMSPNDTSDLRNQKRKSRPPPEDVVQSMINWKRQSGQALSKYISEQQLKDKEIDSEHNEDSTPLPPAVPKKDLAQIHNKQLPAVPQRVLTSNPEILLSPTKEEDDESEALGDDTIELNVDNRDTEIESPSRLIDSTDPKECALRLWNEDEDFVQQDRIAEWLGQR